MCTNPIKIWPGWMEDRSKSERKRTLKLMPKSTKNGPGSHSGHPKSPQNRPRSIWGAPKTSQEHLGTCPRRHGSVPRASRERPGTPLGSQRKPSGGKVRLFWIGMWYNFDDFWSKFDEFDRILGRVRGCNRISSKFDGIFANFGNHDLPEIASTMEK